MNSHCWPAQFEAGTFFSLLIRIPEIEQGDEGVQIELLDKDFSSTVSPVSTEMTYMYTLYALSWQPNAVTTNQSTRHCKTS